MIIDRLIANPLMIVGFVPAILIALTFHEYAHARVAYAYGDQTAARAGRLTLNPTSHLDPIGTLMILIVGIGWARPVPINPYRVRDTRQGLLWVSLAGPLTNFALALATILVAVVVGSMGVMNELFRFTLFYLVQINIILGIFNLLPIPPLDGSKILNSLLPPSSLGILRQIEAYAPIILILVVFLGSPILFFLTRLIFTVFNFIITTVTGVNVIYFIPELFGLWLG